MVQEVVPNTRQGRLILRVAPTVSQLKKHRSDVIETFVTCDAGSTVTAYAVTDATKYALGAARPIGIEDWVVYLLPKETFQLLDGCTVGNIVWFNNQYQVLMAFGGEQVAPIQDAQLKQLKQKNRERQQQLLETQENNSESERQREQMRQDQTRKWHERQAQIALQQIKEKQRLENDKLKRQEYQERIYRERQEQQAQERKLRDQERKRQEQEDQKRQDHIKQEQRLQPSTATSGGCILTAFAVIIGAVLMIKLSMFLLQMIAFSLHM